MTHIEWVKSLKAGDVVGVYEFRGTRLIYKTKVTGRTPSGRIKTESGSVFKPDGWLLISRQSCYSDRQLGEAECNEHLTT
jgi:anaerobic selenocysteine-containing dehydrogenase